jgi:hypothetical protein
LTKAAMRARKAAAEGADLYRLGTLTKSELAEAQYWALQHPLSPGYASAMGIPAGNVRAPDVIMIGRLRAGIPFVTRAAPGSGVNLGGAIEVVVPPGGVMPTGVYVSPPGW